MHTAVGGTELTEVRRFVDTNEARAVLGVRVGDPRAVQWYAQNNRLHGGVKAAVLDELYTAWRADRDAGRTSIMSSDNADVVAELSARAQHDLRAAGRVEHTGVPLRDGNQAGCGDTIVTRLNTRTLRPRLTEHVKNGDLWTVLHRVEDGRLHVRNLQHRGTITLPAQYVAQHVELGYAATIHRTQGLTVQTCHGHLSVRATRELATVAVSRGTEENHLYLDTDQVLALDEPALLPGDLYYRHRNNVGAREAFGAILRHEGAQKSATEELREALEVPFRLWQQVPEYEHGMLLYRGEDATARAEQWVRDAVPDLATAILADHAWPALHAVLQEVCDLGHDPVVVLARRAQERELDTAGSTAKVLHHRVTTHLDELDITPIDRDREYRELFGDDSGADPPGTALAVDDALTGELLTPDPLDPVAAVPPEVDMVEVLDAEIVEDVTWHELAQRDAERATARRAGWRPDDLPGWVSTPPPADDTVADASSGELRDWLRGKAESLSDRVRALAWRAAHARPEWTRHLGPVPHDPLERDQWLRRAGQVAAYRERWQIPAEDTSLLGPPGRGAQRRARAWIERFIHPDVPRPDSGDPGTTGARTDLADLRARAARLRQQARHPQRQPQPRGQEPAPRAAGPTQEPRIRP